MNKLMARLFGGGGRKLRIAYGRIFHEANAFSPILTEREDFTRMHFMQGDELARAAGLRGTELASFMPHAELTGFRQAARIAGNVETVPLLSALAVPGGPLSASCFAWLLDGLLERLREAGPVDGVYLALHGSMQVDGLDSAPEAEILRRVREVVGPSVRIAVSYDLHANLSTGLVEPVDVLVAYRTNPHWDLAPTGYRAGSRLIRVLRGEIQLVHAWRKLPLVLGGGTTIDFLSPMRATFRFMKSLESDPRVVSASLFMVHPYTSAEDLGWAVHVSTNGDEALANKLADELADRAWEARKTPIPDSLSIDAALDRVASGLMRKVGPITLIDGDDIVGAGAPGGNTRIVEALVKNDRGLKVLVPIHDPALVDELWDAPIGTRKHVTLRGTKGYGSPAVALDATVAARTTGDFGRVLRLDVGSFHVAVADAPPLPIHPSFWSALGLPARQADAIVQKNFFHYRMFYAAISFSHMLVATDGATSLAHVRSRRYRVPLHPGTMLQEWRVYDPELRRGKALATSRSSAPATLGD